MKKLTSFLILCAFSLLLHATDPKYQGAMLSAIEDLNHANGNDDIIKTAGIFERIANAEKTLWLPYYYASYSWVMASYNETDLSKKDVILDKAQSLLDSAFLYSENESEVHVLQAFLYPSRIIVDPMNRGMVYMEKCFVSLETAKALNPENPRIFFLFGIMKANIPESIGGGAEIAKANFLEAAGKFKTFKAENSLMPAWGEEANRNELEKLLPETNK